MIKIDSEISFLIFSSCLLTLGIFKLLLPGFISDSQQQWVQFSTHAHTQTKKHSLTQTFV